MTKTAAEKTKEMGRQFVAIGLLHANPLNPNEMSEKQFNLLSDNIEKMGITDPILVRPHPSKAGEYEIVGGEHRWEVAKLQGFTEVPVTLVELNDDDMAFQTVRHNIIGGKMDPAKFVKLVESLNEKYSEGVTAELFGFADEAEFKKLINATAKSLPKEMQQQFKDAAKEIKTIDDLAKVLNTLFANYGDTLPQGYMVFDYGGYENIWLRLQTHQLKDFREVADKVRAAGKGVDHLMAAVLKQLASSEGEQYLASMLAELPDVKVKDDAPYATLDFLD
ncbi:MAG TPA: ParB/RepB/Spo0J family partition protein [Rhizobacter sp.]